MNSSNEFFNIEVEIDVLASLLLNNQNIDKIADILKPEHFYSGFNQQIFTIIQKLINKGETADITNVAYYYKQDDKDDNLNAKERLNEILAHAGDFIPIKERVKIIFELYIKRQINNMTGDIKSEISHNNSLNLLEKIEGQIFDMRKNCHSSSKDLIKIGDSAIDIVNLADKIRHGDAIVGLPTGFEALDQVINGFHKSDLIILAARPSMGKTALALNLAYNIASQFQNDDNSRGGVAFFSLEMSTEQIVTRAISMASGVNSVAIRTGRYPHKDEETRGKARMTDDDFHKIVEVASSFETLPLFIDDTPSISPSMLRTKARMLKQIYGISAIFIDYLQLMRVSEYGNNKVLEISEISQSLKAIAKELDIPVIALSQLSRQVESRDDKRPLLSDLRESGAIEQDADIVMFIYREEYYLEKMKPKDPADPADLMAKDTKEYNSWKEKMYGKPVKSDTGGFITDANGDVKLFYGAKNIADIIIAKHRNGPVGSAKLFFDKHRTAFFDLG